MTTREIRKDKNNKLTKDECIMFLTQYEKYLNGEINSVINPRTNMIPIQNEKRLQYLVKYCKSNYVYEDYEQNIIKGHINTKDTFIPNIDSFDKIFNLLTLPFQSGYRINYIKENNFFKNSNRLDEKTAIYLLKKHNNKYLTEIEKEIRKTIKDFNFYMTITELYNSIDKHIDEGLFNIDELTNKIPQQYYFELLVLSKNTKDLRFKLKNNIIKYTVLRYFNLILRQLLFKYNETDNSIGLVNYLYIMSVNCIETNTINLNLSYDYLSQSFSSSTSCESSKSEKQKYVDNILSNEGINDVDPFSQLEWKKMNLRNLKTVIFVEYYQNNKKFINAFNSRDLYKEWTRSVKQNKPVLNPYTRQPFTFQDKQNIIQKLTTYYPKIVEPKVTTTRRDDIELSRYNIDDNTIVYKIYFRIISYDEIWNGVFNKTVELVSVVLPIYTDTENYEYHIGYINDKIIHLFNTNKLAGKTIPFKIHPVFLKYNKKDKLTFNQYKNFCDML
jgi:hypothetical protein